MFLLALAMQSAYAGIGVTLPNHVDDCGCVINSLSLIVSSDDILDIDKGIVVGKYFIGNDILQAEVLSNAIVNQHMRVSNLVICGKPGQMLSNSTWLGKEEIALFFDSIFPICNSKTLEININPCHFAKCEKDRHAVVYLEKASGLKIVAATYIISVDWDWNLEAVENTSVVKVKNYTHIQSTIVNVNTQLGGAGSASIYSFIDQSIKGSLIQTSSISLEDRVSVFQNMALKGDQLSERMYTSQILRNRHAVTKLFFTVG